MQAYWQLSPRAYLDMFHCSYSAISVRPLELASRAYRNVLCRGQEFFFTPNQSYKIPEWIIYGTSRSYSCVNLTVISHHVNFTVSISWVLPWGRGKC